MIGLSAAVTAEQSFHLLQAKQTIQSAQALTLQLIAFAEGGVGAARVTALAAPLASSFQIALRGSSVRGETQIAADLWPAEIDEGQFSQVIRSLVLNAREATPAGGLVRLRADNLHLDTAGGLDVPAGDYVRIRVEDDGAGIAPDVLPKIFDPYFSTKQRGPQKGMGLGLTICRTVIQKHRGTIFVDSQPGLGTTVTCLLPARPGGRTGRASAQPLPPEGTRILIMDDEQLFREVLASTLRLLGYEVEVTRDGDEAIAAYAAASTAERPFAAVLLDLTVRGGRGGRETLEMLRRQDPEVRAILMTGYSTEAVFRDYASHGFRAALAKPFPLESLRAVMNEVLGSAAARIA
jgi:CheY-like chemotaxis protein